MKSKNDIIQELYENKDIPKIIWKIIASNKNKLDSEFADDLIQDIYLTLLSKDDDLIIDLYYKNQLGFYILKITRNQLLSKTSPYYCKYIKPIHLKRSLNEIIEKDDYDETTYTLLQD